MKKYLNYFIVVFVTVIVSMMFSSYVKVDETKEIEASSYSIERVHFDHLFDMGIYRVRTPNGTFLVMWEETSGGLCVLK
jgi:hypothetical protein